MYKSSVGEAVFILALPQLTYHVPTAYRLQMRYFNADTTRHMFLFPPDLPALPRALNRRHAQSPVGEFEQDGRRVLR